MLDMQKRNLGNDRGHGRTNGGKGKVLPHKLCRGPSEAEILQNVKKILDLFKMQGLLTYRRIHVMPVMRGGVATCNKEMVGMEDVQIYLMNGKTIFLELKTEKGKLSDYQIKRKEELLALGHDYFECHSVDSFIAGLRQRGLSIWSMPV